MLCFAPKMDESCGWDRLGAMTKKKTEPINKTCKCHVAIAVTSQSGLEDSMASFGSFQVELRRHGFAFNQYTASKLIVRRIYNLHVSTNTTSLGTRIDLLDLEFHLDDIQLAARQYRYCVIRHEPVSLGDGLGEKMRHAI